MEYLYHLIQTTLSNTIVSGGLLLMISGAIMALCRKVPFHLWELIKHQSLVTAEIMNRDPLFDCISDWLDEQPYSKKSRRVTVSSKGLELSNKRSNYGDDKEETLISIIFTPAPGNHLLVYNKRIIWLVRDRNNQSPTSELMKSNDHGPIRESYHLTILGRDQSTIRKLINEAVECSKSRYTETVSVYMPHWYSWKKVTSNPPRDYNSVILDGTIAEDILDDALKFLASRDWYRMMGIPYHRGYLPYGVPGSGKTSLISALAGKLGLNLYYLNIGDSSMNDDSLNKLMLCTPPNCIILIEDIDAVFKERVVSNNNPSNKDLTPSSESSGVSFSGLLNVLDGVAAKEGVMVFMTTNHINRLDPALIRPGRVDMRIEFNYASHDQIRRLFNRFYPDYQHLANDFVDSLPDKRLSMAQIQQHLLIHRDSPTKAIAYAENIKAGETAEYYGIGIERKDDYSPEKVLDLDADSVTIPSLQ